MISLEDLTYALDDVAGLLIRIFMISLFTFSFGLAIYIGVSEATKGHNNQSIINKSTTQPLVSINGEEFMCSKVQK